MTNIAMENIGKWPFIVKMAIEIVDSPMKHGDVP
jgi:hypothetical protein